MLLLSVEDIIRPLW